MKKFLKDNYTAFVEAEALASNPGPCTLRHGSYRERGTSSTMPLWNQEAHVNSKPILKNAQNDFVIFRLFQGARKLQFRQEFFLILYSIIIDNFETFCLIGLGDLHESRLLRETPDRV